MQDRKISSRSHGQQKRYSTVPKSLLKSISLSSIFNSPHEYPPHNPHQSEGGSSMSAQDKAANLFEYISKVYAIDLPVARIVTGYDDLFWRQADLIPCSHCRIREFDRGNKTNETNEPPEAVAEDAWLAVYKSSYDDPPPLPLVLKEWVAPSSNPTRRPKPAPTREGGERFEDKPSRPTALNNYLETQWDPWAKQVLPLFKANELYDQLFTLHQRLSVEGD